MRKSLWIILIVLFAAIGAPNARADSFAASFTCTSITCGILPTASDVSFPTPTTINITFAGEVSISFDLPSADSFHDSYSWAEVAVSSATPLFTIWDHTTGTIQSTLLPLCTVCGITYSPPESGALAFTAVPVVTPEPSSVALILAGVGLVFVMRKRI